MSRTIAPGVLAACSGILLLAAAQTAFAQCEKAHTHRPVEDLFASDVVYLQERGETQVEVKPARTRAGSVHTSTLEMDIEYGPRDWWQIEAEWDAREWTRVGNGAVDSEVGDVGLGTRFGWRCIGGSPYHLSVGMDVAIPSDAVGDPRQLKRHVALAPSIIVAREVSRTAHLFTAFELEAPLNAAPRDEADRSYTSDTGLFVRIVRGFRVTAELSVEGRAHEEREVHVLPGVLWHRGDTIEIGVGMLTPVSHHTSRGVLGHVVCEFGGRHGPASEVAHRLRR